MGKKQKGKQNEAGGNADDVDIDALAEEIEAAGSAPAAKGGGEKKGKRKKQKNEFCEDDILKELEELSLDSEAVKKEVAKPVATRESDDESQGASKQEKGAKGKQQKAGKKPEEEVITPEDDATTAGKKGKKKGKQKQEVNEESEEELLPAVGKKKGKKGKQQQRKGSDESDEEQDQINKPSADSVKDVDSDQEEHAAGKKKKGAIKPTASKEEPGGKEPIQPQKDMVELSEGDSEEEDEGISKKGKKKKPKEVKAESDDEVVEEGERTVKTAAQKRAEKKERERKKREEEKLKIKLKKDQAKPNEGGEKVEDQATAAPAKAPESKEPKAAAETADAEVAAEEEEDDGAGKKKKKDKKKKTGEKGAGEEKPEKKKGISKATVKAMQEVLQQRREEQERAQREEEERIRRLEEAEALCLEQERLEAEKKERKKQKEKERKERLKQEGKLMSNKQKQDKARAEAMLKAIQEQGFEIPSKEAGLKKRPVYDDRRKKQKQLAQDSKAADGTAVTEVMEVDEASTPVEEAPVESPVEEPTATEEVVPEEQDDELDDWEMMANDTKDEPEDGPRPPEKVHIEVKGGESAVDGHPEEAAERETESGSEVDSADDSKDDDDDDEDDDDESESESESESDTDDRTKEQKIYDNAKKRIEKRRADNLTQVTLDRLRAPVICVLGHVDTGKTKILDKLRHTHVQDGEAGGITQQIGATNVPLDAIKEQTKMIKEFDRDAIKLPGMLIIDTPGHESFSNLRNRGSSLCDIAILVVDVMHGLEPQTIESINLLKTKKCPFIVALNKIDRLYDWKRGPDSDVVFTIKKQKKNTKDEFDVRVKSIIAQFAEQGLNAALFYENKDTRTYLSMVPTSAHTGDGMGNLIALVVELTQTLLAKRVAYSPELSAQVMEVKSLPGLGTTIDVVLTNGILREGETIVLAGVEGPIVTQIRGLLMPQPLKELRVKNQYEKFKEVVAAQGVKIIAKDLEKALAGLPLLVACHDDEVPVLRDEMENELKQTLSAIKLEERGVYVQASTLGSLEALLEFLRTSIIPYSGINIGPVHKRDIMKASIMLEHDSQYAVILAFDVKVEREAQDMAESLGVKIFSADIIYHLFDAFTKYRADLKRRKQEEFRHIAVFPCKLRILPQFIFNSRDPIVCGVNIEAGILKNGTPICVPSKGFVDVGVVTSLEINHKAVDVARKGQEVCIKIEPVPGEAPKMFGRHFEASDFLVSKISRASIDALKDWFRDEMSKTDWQLIVELKKTFEIL
ncbi:eukaryotic translation initiation factor 5B isoform X2 [Lampetra fluviatilis]